MEKCLLIDAATPLVQAVILEGGKIFSWKATSGNATDFVSALVGKLMAEAGIKFADLDSMAYCRGPGSAMGLRTALISIKVWMIFAQKPLGLLEYDGFDMCLRLNPEASGVCTNFGKGSLLVKLRGEHGTKVHDFTDGEKLPDGVVFMGTRRTRSEKCANIAHARYSIGDGDFEIPSICEVSSGELDKYENNSFTKWNSLPIAQNEQ
ncbi:MAG: hypothetical protein LBB18_02725 [Puniceicoccales bacterium]|jgi:hypothetical protein|nr:hypothetical protein [Puniceicoccales bacterium]